MRLLRWGWAQLTSMRTALVLLFALALAAIPALLTPFTRTRLHTWAVPLAGASVVVAAIVVMVRPPMAQATLL